MSAPELIERPTDRDKSLRNLTCIYCGVTRQTAQRLTREHVIGRRFVPSGSLIGEWNLIANACRACNAEKADLEDDISAILLHPGISQVGDESELFAKSARKATRSISRRTRKPVSESVERLEVGGRNGPFEIKFGMVAAPQLDFERAARLAWFHLQGFIYLQTYDQAKKQGRHIEDCVSIADARRDDWGNERLVWFADYVKDWSPTLNVNTASRYFRLVFRYCPFNDNARSFALEWNKRYRIVGFLGGSEGINELAAAAPELKWGRVDANRRYRLEVPLDEADDLLFSLPMS